MRFIEELLVGDAADRWHLSVGIQMLEPLVTRLESLMQELIFRVGPSKDPHSAGSAEPGRTKLTLRSVQGPRHSRLDVPHGRAFSTESARAPLSAAECRRCSHYREHSARAGGRFDNACTKSAEDPIFILR